MMVQFKKLNENATLPTRGTVYSAGLDLYASAPLTLAPGAYGLVSTGLSMAMEFDYEAQIRPRSGLAAKYGVTVLNAPGTIDSDYRGEVKVVLINHGTGVFNVNVGDRIAQMVINRLSSMPEIVEVSELTETVRGSGGFGSTGT
jgi:dUTP pyrophosphatase